MKMGKVTSSEGDINMFLKLEHGALKVDYLQRVNYLCFKISIFYTVKTRMESWSK